MHLAITLTSGPSASDCAEREKGIQARPHRRAGLLAPCEAYYWPF